MRLLQLALGRDEHLDLHPNMTVVQGLDDDARRVLVEAVRGLARSEASPGGGLLEAHGVLFELRGDLLGVLDLAVVDIDPVVRPGDLPSQPLTVDGRELKTKEQEFSLLLERISSQAERQSRARDAVAAAETAVRRARRALADRETGGDLRRQQVDALTDRRSELAQRRARIQAAQEALLEAQEEAEVVLAEVEARTEGVRARAREALGRLAAVEAERDGLAVDLSEAAAAELDRALRAHDEVVATVEAERAAAVGSTSSSTLFEARAPDADQPEVLLQRIGVRLADVDRRLAALAAGATDEVVDALTAVRAGGAGDLVPSVEAAVLADDLRSLAFEIGADDAELVVEGSLAEARERLDGARQALLEAEQGVRNPQLDRGEVDRLEDAHEALLGAIDKAGSRFGGGRARERVERLREAEQEVLDRLGFASYSDYMMGSSLLPADPAKEAALDAARSELASAEDGWRRLEQATDAALARAALLDRRRALVDSARRFLDPMPAIDELAAALRLVRVPATSVEQAASRLRAALERQGLDLGHEDLDVDEVAMFAQAWLDEVAAATERSAALHEERAALGAEASRLQAAVDAGSTPGYILGAVVSPPDEPGSDDPAEAERRERLEAASASLAEAEDRWLAHEVAAEGVAILEPRLVAVAEEAVAASGAAAAAESEVGTARHDLDVLRTRAAQLEDELAQVAAEEGEVEAALEVASRAGQDPAALQAALHEAEAQERDAELDLDAETRLLASLDADGQAVAIEIERLQDIVASQTNGGEASEAEELEWYLLARLAAQRSVSVAGALPLLLDDALRGLDAAGVDHLLGRLERMTEAVQVILVSEDPVVAAWADDAGPARAAVVRPTAA